MDRLDPVQKCALFGCVTMALLAGCGHTGADAEASPLVAGEPTRIAAPSDELADFEGLAEDGAEAEASPDPVATAPVGASTARAEAPAEAPAARVARARPASPTRESSRSRGLAPEGYAGGAAATPRPSPRRVDTPRAPGASPPPRPASPGSSLRQQALPQNGVLASSFVGGSGVSARLEDLLDRGVMVGGQNVRIEAFGDRERLPYAVPSEEAVAMYAELERSRLPHRGDRVHLQVALVARQGEAPRRPRMDVRLVLDRSGSMSADGKWHNALQAAHALVDRLQPGDTFGLVSYAEDATVDLAPTRVGNRALAHAAIRRLVPGGGTNIGAALDLVAANAPRRQSPNDLGLVVLVSDGRVTVGQSNPQELGRTTRRMFDSAGVLTTAVGLGTDFDEQTMLTIAREGSGSYHFVRRPGDIEEILTDELEDRAQAVAQALRVRVELSDGVRATRVYGSRLLSEQEHAAVRATEVATDSRLAAELGIARTRQQEEERGLRIHLPTFRRGDQHVILMELEVPPGADASRVARVTLDYKDLPRNRNDRIVRDVTAERTGDAQAAIASTSRLVKRTVLSFQAGEALQLAADSLSTGDASTAMRDLAERRELLNAAADLWRDDSLRADAAMLARYERVLQGAWPSWDTGSQRTLVLAMNHFGDQRMR